MESRKANHAVRSWPRTTLNQIKWNILFTKTTSHNSKASQSLRASNSTGSEAINHCGRGTVCCFFRRDCRQSWSWTTEHTYRNPSSHRTTNPDPAASGLGLEEWACDWEVAGANLMTGELKKECCCHLPQRLQSGCPDEKRWSWSEASSRSSAQRGTNTQCCWGGTSTLSKLHLVFYLSFFFCTLWEMSRLSLFPVIVVVAVIKSGEWKKSRDLGGFSFQGSNQIKPRSFCAESAWRGVKAGTQGRAGKICLCYG